MSNANVEHLDTCILCGSGEVVHYDKTLLLDRCRECGLVFDNPRPTLGAIAEYYSNQGKYDRWEELEEGIRWMSRRRAGRIARFKKSGKLLDVGAGTGQFLRDCRDMYDGSGTELSSEAVKVARERFGVSLREGVLEEIDFGEDRFDVISMSQVLEHVPQPGETLDVCRGLLAPGGVLYVSVPNEPFYSLRRIAPRLLALLGVKRFRSFRRRGMRRLDLGEVAEIHLSHFSERILRRGFARHGFKVLGAGVDYHDALMFSRGPKRLAREVAVLVARIVRLLTGLNIYNCLWIVVTPVTEEKKPSSAASS